MDTWQNRDRNIAIFGTIGFHALLVVLFLLFGLSTPLPLPEEHGVLVSLGYMDEGTGDAQPLAAPPPVPQSPPSTPTQEPDRTVTQDTYESVALPEEVADLDTSEDLPESERHDPTPLPEETVAEEIQEEPAPQVDPRALFPGRDQQSTDRQDQGETEETGDQGRPEGAIAANQQNGTGPVNGPEFDLRDRSAISIPLPDYTTPETGRVVVQITVNRQGEVIRATAGVRGSTTQNSTLLREAEQAARRARFSTKADAPEEQTGTITYNFIRLN